MFISARGESPSDYPTCITTLLASKGLLWIGTNVGFMLTLPLPRLEGVPLISARPTVSYHAHNGPIKFLAPIYCGISEPMALSGLPYEGDEDVFGSESPKIHVDAEGNEFLSLEGATEDDTQDDNVMESESEGESPEFDDEPRKSMMTRWSSQPLLSSAGGEESVKTLYGSLLRGVHLDLDRDILAMGKPKGKHSPSPSISSAIGSTYEKLQSRHKKFKFMRTKSQQAAVDLDESFEQNPIYEDSFEPDSPNSPLDGRQSRESPPPSVAPSSISMNKSVIIASGGDGHINWSDKRAQDSRYEDICLLLWQSQGT